ncbi:hypothetical protein DOM21_08695 [Bacteriovorax stolpii]|uniref:Uncharacterized protein n=1 Tax=Bacteriovorax stolpii TaxID=960 RepID=A0A2K9NSJ7_BACTC|nr:hypothetical protein [Bacteriovorax stolpii]AUN98493.1 hypothetical protein C0V70_10320 [Bacteriovorax stolpii]QDK41527.1 hypothetical protein DOM21_08695 [Bacteriovorax stolpii]TDP50882.1 hypothetical protein C8D79_3619 [Bacteriovorax stolpii]
MRKLLCLISLMSLPFSEAFALAAHRGGAELLNPKAYSIMTSAMVWQTSATLDEEGVETTLADGSEYRLIDVDFGVSYGISKNLEATLFGRFRSVTSTLNDVTASNSGPESVAIEGKYAFDPIGNLRYAIAAHYRQTLYSNATYDGTAQLPTEEVILGDAGSEYGVDLLATYSSASWKWDMKVGYNNPANDNSEEVVYKLEGMYRLTKLGLLAGVEGIYSLKKDQFTETPLLKPVQATGASKLFYSINREKLAPYVGANYAFDKILFGIKGQTVVSGRSTDKGSSLLASLTWNSEGVTPESVKVESFKEYIVDGSVLKVSARGNFIRIDQGLSTDVEKGMKFDIYQTDYFGGNVLVASGIAYEIGADWSIIKLVKKYKEIEIKPGFAARGY